MIGKRVLITGASGFCGRYLSRYLSGLGHQVFGTTKSRDDLPVSSPFSFIPLDLQNEKQINLCFKKVKPEWVFHLAAMSIPRLSWQMPDVTFDINAGGTVRILEAMRRHVPKARLVFVSTVQVYGRQFRTGTPVKENDPLWPESPYGTSKLVAEFACLDYHRRFGIDVVIARPFNHIGSGMSRELVLSDWSSQIAEIESGKRKDRNLRVGNIDVYREFLHVADVVEAYELLARKGSSGETYNVAMNKPELLADYVRLLVKASQVKVKIKIEKKRMRLDDPKVMTGSNDKLCSLGWKPKRNGRQALQEVLNDWRKSIS